MPPAVVAAGIGAAGAIGGGLLSASAQKKAANKAADTSLQTAQANNALAREFRTANQANFQPWLNSGTHANSLIDSFLYGPSQAAPAASPQLAPQTNPGFQASQAGAFGDPAAAVAGGFSPHTQNRRIGPIAGFGGDMNAMMRPRTQAAQPPQAAQPAQNPLAPQSGFQAFVNSPYYQFGQNEGMRALNTGLASHGMIESGDAMKAAIRYGQDYGYSQGLMPFINLAGQQSDRGIQGASAIAGVGQNALASMTANNNMAGNVAANAQLARGAANAGMYSTIGGALGTLAGTAFGGSSYRGY